MTATDYGFEWPVDGAKSNVKVERMALLPGNYRVIGVITSRRKIELYVSPTGLIRVFAAGKELS